MNAGITVYEVFLHHHQNELWSVWLKLFGIYDVCYISEPM